MFGKAMHEDEMVENLIAMCAALYANGATRHGDKEKMQADGLIDEFERPTEELMSRSAKVAVAAINEWVRVCETGDLPGGARARFFN